MSKQPIRFDDGAAYERGMGIWSQIAGNVFLDWLAPAPGLRWVDVGCGNGAFTELLMRRCAPSEMQGIDPSDAQLAFARTRPGVSSAVFTQGDAMALPFEAGRFDAAVMALVLFFVPEPAKGVAEMIRVVRPGGTIAAYVWDILGGGFTLEPIQRELRAAGFTPTYPPSVEISRMDALRGAWMDAGLRTIETREIKVQRTFADFEEFWSAGTGLGTILNTLATMPAAAAAQIKDRVRASLPADSQGRVTYEARCNAVKGTVPG